MAAVYPVEFVVRAFLGTYPGLHMPRGQYAGKRVLDLGYGDGRNMPLLENLGMRVHGVEIAESINRHVRRRLSSLHLRAVLKVGSNASIPYSDRYFDYLVACHSCYYVAPGDTFETNLAELARVLKPGGYLIASLPMKGSYILRAARPSGPAGHYEIREDPYRLRVGTVFRVFNSRREITRQFRHFFDQVEIGYCSDDFWGIHQKVWTVVCRRRGD